MEVVGSSSSGPFAAVSDSRQGEGEGGITATVELIERNEPGGDFVDLVVAAENKRVRTMGAFSYVLQVRNEQRRTSFTCPSLWGFVSLAVLLPADGVPCTDPFRAIYDQACFLMLLGLRVLVEEVLMQVSMKCLVNVVVHLYIL